MQRSIETLRVLLKDDPRLVDLADSAWGWRSETVAPTPAFKAAKPVVLSRDAAKVVGENIGSPSPGDATTAVPWSGVTDKPLTFPPSEHTHTWGSIADKPLTFPPSAHTHVWADITDGSLVLDGYLPLTAGASKVVTGNLHLGQTLMAIGNRAGGFIHAQFGGGTAGNAGTIRFARGTDINLGAAIGFEASANEASEFRFSAFGNTTSYMAWHLRDASSTREVMRLNTSGGLSVGSGADTGAGTINAQNGFWVGGTETINSARAAFLTNATISTHTSGRILRAGTGGLVTSDDTLTWATGPLVTIGNNTSTTSRLQINGATNQLKGIRLLSNGVNLWSIVSDSTAQTGSDTGARLAIIANNDTGTEIDRPIEIVRAAGGSIIFNRPVSGLALSGLTAGRVMFVGAGGVPTDTADFRYANRILTIDGTEPRYYLHGPATAGRFFSTRTNNLNVWEWGTPGTGWDATQPWVLIAYNDAEAEIDRPIIVGRAANTNITFSRKLVLPTGTTTRAGLNLGGTGVAPATPVDGDVWRVADQAYIRMGSNTREVLLSGPNQTIGGIKTFQGHIICATPSGGIASLVLPAGTTTLTSEGTTWNDSVRRALMTRINGLNQELVGCIWQGVNLTAVSGTTFTSMLSGGASTGTLTLPANTLAAAKMLRIKAGILPTGGSPVPMMRVTLGGVVVAQFTAGSGLTVGVHGTVDCLIAATAAPGASVTVNGYGRITHRSITSDGMTTTSGTVATNGSLALAIECQTLSGSDTIQLTHCTIELL